MKNKIGEYAITFFLVVLIMTVIGLEVDFEIVKYLIFFGVVSTIVVFVLKRLKFRSLTFESIPIITFGSLLFSYILLAYIIMWETDMAFSKIKSIPKENLNEFFESGDIKSIPNGKRRAWIGVLYRKIGIIQIQSSKRAIGWNGYSVFAYYDIDKDEYNASYH